MNGPVTIQGARSWLLEVHDREPLLMNAERNKHWSERHADTRAWRNTIAWLAKAQRIPRLAHVVVDVEHDHGKPRGRVPDVGAVFPQVKAAIDGLVDAGVLEHDGPPHVIAVVFASPIRAERHRLAIRVHEVLVA